MFLTVGSGKVATEFLRVAERLSANIYLHGQKILSLTGPILRWVQSLMASTIDTWLSLCQRIYTWWVIWNRTSRALDKRRIQTIFSHTHVYGIEKSLCFLVSGEMDPISLPMWDKCCPCGISIAMFWTAHTRLWCHESSNYYRMTLAFYV